MIREVLNYKHGKLMSTNLHMTLPHTLYKQALEYVKEFRESKTEFMKSISELHENSKRNLDEIRIRHFKQFYIERQITFSL